MPGKRNLSINKILFLFSFLLGILAVTILANGKFPNNTIMDQMLGQTFLDEGWNKTELLIQCLFQRGLFFIVICILAYTQIRRILFRIVLVWTGVVSGVTLKLFFLWYGMSGIGLFAVSLLPHYIFYWMACGLLYWESDPQKKYRKRNYIPFLLMIGVVIMGIVFESYVNPILVNIWIKIFFKG